MDLQVKTIPSENRAKFREKFNGHQKTFFKLKELLVSFNILLIIFLSSPIQILIEFFLLFRFQNLKEKNYLERKILQTHK